MVLKSSDGTQRSKGAVNAGRGGSKEGYGAEDVVTSGTFNRLKNVRVHGVVFLHFLKKSDFDFDDAGAARPSPNG
jgi:hypothetical protein